MLAYHIVFDLIGYFLLLIAALLILAAIGTLVFRDLSEFETIEDSLITLFESCWGEFSFADTDDGRFGEGVGYVFMVVVIVCIVLVLTNFLIALYAAKYTQFTKNMKAIMMNEALKARPVSEANKYHSSLISGAFPLNGLNWISPMFMFIPRSPKIANEVFLHIQYFPIMIVVTLLFILYNILIWPVTYLKLIPHKFALIFKKNVAYTGNTSNRIGSFFLILFIGPLLLLLNIFVDAFYFVLHMYKYDLEKVDDSIKHIPDLSMKTYNVLYTYLESNPSPYMSYEKVACDIRDKLDVMTSIKQMLFPHRAIHKRREYQKSADQIVNEYIIVKKILLNNSITVSTTKLFPNNVKKVYKELRFNKRILQYNLLEMLRFRNLLLLKRRIFLFTVLYEGNHTKDDESARKRQYEVEKNISEHFNYINTSRVLKAIGYKPKEKVVSHDAGDVIEEASDIDIDVADFRAFDRKDFKMGGLLSRNTSKISIRRALTDGAKKSFRHSTSSDGEYAVADAFRVGAVLSDREEIERKLDRIRDDDSITPIPNLGDSDNSDAEFPDEVIILKTAKKEDEPTKAVPPEQDSRPYDIKDSDDTEYEDEEEEDDIGSENIDFSKDTRTWDPNIN